MSVEGQTAMEQIKETRGNATLKIYEYPKDKGMDALAKKAEYHDIYTVQSMLIGVCYFCADGEIAISNTKGYVRMSEKTAQRLVSELSGIISDLEYLHREGISLNAEKYL